MDFNQKGVRQHKKMMTNFVLNTVFNPNFTTYMRKNILK